jgi:Cytochrome c
VSRSPRCGRASAALLASALLLALAGCASGTSSHGAQQSAVPGYVTEPFTHQQQLIAQGARLVVADGCAACHLIGSAAGNAPSFSRFAGHQVTLTDGHSVLVDEQFVRESLLDPSTHELEGYRPAPMLAALERLHLRSQPQQVAALAAFIEQVGPDSE